MKQRIYIADDEANIRFIIRSFLIRENYEVEEFNSGDALMERFNQTPCDLVILDVMMEGTDGLTICRKLRDRHPVPIIIVSALDSELDRITGITMGSDDYLVKPFSPVELVARVKALFRRIRMDQSAPVSNQQSYGELRIHRDLREVTLNNQKLDLTPTEYAVLTYLVDHADRAVSRQELLQKVWNFSTEADTRATDDVMKRLRKKLIPGSIVIETVWGFGFKLTRRTSHETPA